MYLKRIYYIFADTIYVIVDSTVETVRHWRVTAKKNRSDLIRGSVLDPLNHPSYSKDKH